MIQFALRNSSYLDVAKYFYKVWETPMIKEEVEGKGREVSHFLFGVRIDVLMHIFRLWKTLFITWFLLHMTTSSPT